MLSHPVRQTELADCLSLRPASRGDELTDPARALVAWQHLLASPAFHASVVERELPSERQRILGFGATVFVSRDFAEAEIGSPQPGLNSRILASIGGSQPVVLSDRQLCLDNSGDGLHLVVLVSAWRPGLTPDAACDVRARLTANFLEAHLGYHLKCLLMEATNDVDVEQAASAQRFRLHSTFEQFHKRYPMNRWNRDRALFVMTREDAMSASAVIAGILFERRTPQLMLHPTDQQLIQVAQGGGTDAEIALALGVSVSAVKKRWLALFDRLSRIKPGLVPDESMESLTARGPQKKHKILAYLRDRPEELRPLNLGVTHGSRSLSSRRRRSVDGPHPLNV